MQCAVLDDLELFAKSVSGCEHVSASAHSRFARREKVIVVEEVPRLVMKRQHKIRDLELQEKSFGWVSSCSRNSKRIPRRVRWKVCFHRCRCSTCCVAYIISMNEFADAGIDAAGLFED